MKTRVVLAVCLCVVTTIAVAAAPRGKRSRSRQAAVNQVGPGVVLTKGIAQPGGGAWPAFAAHDAAPSQPVWAVNVLSSLGLDGVQQQLYQNMANVLSNVAAIPASRTAYWSALDNPPGSTIDGWYGSVTSVTPDGNGGNLVTVLTAPYITLQSEDSPVADGDYSEQWDIDANNNATFVGSSDPNGTAGLYPTLIY